MITEKRHGSQELATLAIGTLLSVGLGAFFYFRSDIKSALPTFAGLLGTTITLQVQSLLRERRVAEDLTREQRLIGEIEAVKWLPSQLEIMLDSINAISQSYPGTMAVNLSRTSFEECLAQIKNLQRGHFDVRFDDNRLLYALTEDAQQILATSVEGIDLCWWQSPAGQTYWRIQVKALRRGARITRIFIYQKWTHEHEELARKQSDAGVKVLRVQQDLLNPELKLDMIIWDGQCGFESKINATGQEPISNNYTFAQPDLSAMTELYKVIESCAAAWIDNRSVHSEHSAA